MGFKLKDLRFGELNTLKRNNLNASGDRRRTSAITAIRFATEKAYEINTLKSVKKFTGFVVGVREVSRAIGEYKDTIISLQETDTAQVEIKNYLYKVYIPELEPLPAPTSYQDPVIGLYADMSLAKGAIGIAGHQLAQGDLVEVAYTDVERLLGPKIIRVLNASGLTTDTSEKNSGRNRFKVVPATSIGDPKYGSVPETNPGVARVKKTSSRVNWGGDPKMQEMLEALNKAAENQGIYLAVTSAHRNGYDQARIMRDNYFKNGGTPFNPATAREYISGIYRTTGPKYADILEKTHLTKDQQIRLAVDTLPYMSNNNHTDGVSLDIRWGFSTTDKTPRAKGTPPAEVTRAVAEAMKLYPIGLLMENDHYHLTALGKSGTSTVRFAISKKGTLASKAIADGLLGSSAADSKPGEG